MSDPTVDAAVVEAEARRVTLLRMDMVEAHPFWGHLLLQVRLVPAPTLPSFAATDCVRHIWYNPLLTVQLSYRQLGFVLAHEIVHQIQAVGERRSGRNPFMWNMALDYVANRLVAAIRKPGAGEGLPPPWADWAMYDLPRLVLSDGVAVAPLFSRRFDGMVSEAVYEALCADKPVSDSPPLDLELPDPRTRGKIKISARDHGGGLDVHWPWEIGADDVREIKERIEAAAGLRRQLDGHGDMPGDFLRTVLPVPGPNRVAWVRIFRNLVGQAVLRNEYSPVRPNRRYAMCDAIVPGRVGEGVGTAVVAIDTSGSIGKDDLDIFAAEAGWLARIVDHLVLIVADAAVLAVYEDDAALAALRKGVFPGGGGTDHRPVFARIEEKRMQPDVFVGLTDLCTALPPRRPAFPVVWVVPHWSNVKPPWGTVVRLPESAS